VRLGDFSFENALFSHVHGQAKEIYNIEDNPKICVAGSFSFEHALFCHVSGKPNIIHNIEANLKICAAWRFLL
jgi:hypothetical protein